LNPLLNVRLRKLTAIVIVWMFIGLLLSVYDHLVLITYSQGGIHESYSFRTALTFHLASSFMGAMLGGWFLIFVIDKRFKSQPYIRSILAVCIVFVAIFSVIILITSCMHALFENDFNFYDPKTKQRILELILTPIHLNHIMFWATVVALTQITLQVNDKFGQGLFWSMIAGKYHLPKAEERIFMFLDLKSSTSIAERLGNKKYHGLLKDVFSDITDPILSTRGEIYQYIGDEVVISWTMEKGVKHSHCIACYFGIKKVLDSFRTKYISKYDVLPEFKAGLHYGMVIAGEIGVIKRDITYSGDVLNTTARIQGKCNDFEQALIVSEELMKRINQIEAYNYDKLGDIKLKGKEQKVSLYGVEEIS